ncbi:FtsZ-binding cell division protein ZapB [Bradyrhizobium japonicum]
MGLNNAERQARFRAKRDAEIERLRKASNKPVPASQELDDARAEIKRLTKEVTLEQIRNLGLNDEVERLKAKIAKPAKVPLDPESEAARQIAALKKRNKTLQAEADKWLTQLRTLVPAGVKTKVAKALTEQTTSPAKRLDALQAWNGLGLNNIGR